MKAWAPRAWVLAVAVVVVAFLVWFDWPPPQLPPSFTILKGATIDVLLTPRIVAELGGSLRRECQATNRGTVVVGLGQHIFEIAETESEPDDIEHMLRRLRELGQEPGTMDGKVGVVGPKTRAALKAIQRAHGLVETERLDDETAEILGLPSVAAARLAEVPGLHAFTLDGEGYLWVIDDHGLRRTDGKQIEQVFALPSSFGDARVIAFWETTLYLYGSNPNKNTPGLVALTGDGHLEYLVRTEEPLVSIEPIDGAVYFATRREIYRLAGRDSIRLVFAVPDGLSIESIAASTEGDVIFFATRDQVFALEGGIGVALTNNLGGTLSYDGRKLFICDAARHLVARLSRNHNLKGGLVKWCVKKIRRPPSRCPASLAPR